MRTTTAIASLLAAAACVSATSSSHPVLAFTSQQAASTKLELPSESSLSSFVDSILASGKSSSACKLDAVAILVAEKTGGETFASLRHTPVNSLRARAMDAPSQVTFNGEYEHGALTKIAGQFAKACRLGRFHLTNMTDPGHLEPTKEINLVTMHVSDLRKQEPQILDALKSLDETHPRNLVIIAQNAQLHRHNKRQFIEPLKSDGNWTEPTGGIFAKYQLFSTPLILTLLLVGGLLLPIVYFTVSQLAQMQTPDQMGVRKDPISGDKKTQ